MKRITMTVPALAARPSEYLAAIAPAVLQQVGAVVFLDADHPAYAKASSVHGPAPAPTAPAPPAVAGGAWGPVHAWAATVDVRDAGVVRAGLRRVIAQLPGNRGQQLAAAAERNPPPAGDRYALCHWCLDLQNATRARVGSSAAQRAPITYADAADRYGWPKWPATARHVHQSALGLGDAIVGLYAACGLAEAVGEPVVYHARHTAWLARASHPGVFITNYAATGPDINAGLAGYNHQLAHAASRVGAYCENAAKGLKVGTFAPTPPALIDRANRSDDNPDHPYVVLAPFSHHRVREWPHAHWKDLARRIVAMGLVPVSIDSSDQLRQRQIQETFGDVPGAMWITGRTSDQVADLLLGAECTIGNDSGVVHVGGLLGVPTVCIHAGAMSHDFLFGQYGPAVTSVTSGRALPRGGDSNQGELARVSVDAVVAELQRRLGVWPRVLSMPSLTGLAMVA